MSVVSRSRSSLALALPVINANGAKDYGLEVENQFQLSPHLGLEADVTWIPHAGYNSAGGIDPVLAGSRFRFAPRLSANVAANLEKPVNDTTSVTGRIPVSLSRWSVRRHRGQLSPGSRKPGRFEGRGRVSSNRLQTRSRCPQPLQRDPHVEQVLATPLQAGSYSGFLGAPRTFEARATKTF